MNDRLVVYVDVLEPDRWVAHVPVHDVRYEGASMDEIRAAIPDLLELFVKEPVELEYVVRGIDDDD